jgi:hypothetical protein
MNKKIITLILILLSLRVTWASDKIVINEIMYNSPGNDVEYIELYNISDAAVNVAGWHILDDNDNHDPCLLSGIINPGDYLVIVGDFTLFYSQYQGVFNVNPNTYNAGGNGWSLGNGGDVVRLFEEANVLHDIVAYNDGGTWPGSADGNGPSIELLNPLLDNELPINWDPSLADWGTPGRQNSVYASNLMPVCKDGGRNINLPKSSDEVIVTVVSFDQEGLAKVELMLDTGAGFSPQQMYDDGTRGDGVAGDSIFTLVIGTQQSGTLVKYYAKATDNIGQTDKWPNDAPMKYHAYTVDHTLPNLRINEVLAINSTGLIDEFGENDDWFEIYNAGEIAVNLQGMFVSDAMGASQEYQLPAVTIAPGEYLLLWADNDEEQGTMHTNFKFSSGGEAIALFETVNHGNVLIHGWKYGIMSPDISMGYYPKNGNAPEYLKNPTPGASNESSELFSPVCINEFQATSDFGGADDWIEIFNRSNDPYNLSGCFLSDERTDNTKWIFPEGTILNPGEFLVIFEDVLHFGFSSQGNDVILFTASDSTTGLDFYDFGVQLADISEGRFPDGTNNWNFFKPSTEGSANANPTGISKNKHQNPRAFVLSQNFPNPFNPTTNIRFEIPTAGEVNLTVYNIIGQVVKALINELKPAGSYQVIWNATNNEGDKVKSGLYFYRLEFGSQIEFRKMILMK